MRKTHRLQFTDVLVEKDMINSVNNSNLVIAVDDTKSIQIGGANLQVGILHSLTQIDLDRTKTKLSPVIHFNQSGSLVVKERLWLRELPFTFPVHSSGWLHA